MNCKQGIVELSAGPYNLLSCENTDVLFGDLFERKSIMGHDLETKCLVGAESLVNNSPGKVWVHKRASTGEELVDCLVQLMKDDRGGGNQPAKRTCAAIPVNMDDAHSAVVFVGFVDKEVFLYDPHGVYEEDGHPVLEDIEQAVQISSHNTTESDARRIWTTSTCRGDSFQSYLPLPLCDLFVAYAMCVVSCCFPDRGSVREAWSTLLVRDHHLHGLVDQMEWFYRFMHVLLRKTRRFSTQSGDSVLVFGSGDTGCAASVVKCDKKRQVADVFVAPHWVSPKMLAMASNLDCPVVSPWDGGVRINNVPTIFMVPGSFEFI